MLAASELNRAEKTLELEFGYSLDDAKKARRELQIKFHPDRFQDCTAKELAQEKMIDIARAYTIVAEHLASTQSADSESHNEPHHIEKPYAQAESHAYTAQPGNAAAGRDETRANVEDSVIRRCNRKDSMDNRIDVFFDSGKWKALFYIIWIILIFYKLFAVVSLTGGISPSSAEGAAIGTQVMGGFGIVMAMIFFIWIWKGIATFVLRHICKLVVAVISFFR